MENILIKFTADTGALDEINQKIAITKQNIAGLATGGGSSSGSPSATGPVSNKGKTSTAGTEDQVKANQKLIKSNDDLLKKYDEMSKKFKTLQDTVKASSTNSTQSLNALAAAQKNVNAQIGNTAATESFRTQLKNMKSEIISLELAGQKGSDKYNELIQKAGELSDAMKDTSNAISNSGSDTQAFDSIIAGTELIAGGFSVATGAAALFGVGTDDVARMQVRLQSAIAITTGLQSVGNAVQRDGALIQGIVKAQTYAGIVAKKLENSTTWAGVIAQKALNAAAMANPYLLMAMAIITVVGAIWAWNAGSDKQADKQARINELETLRIQSLENMASRYKEAGAEREKIISHELELAKASGASQQELAKIEGKLMAEKLANATGLAGKQEMEIKALDDNIQKVKDLEDALIALAVAKTNDKSGIVYKVGVQVKTAKVGEDGQKQIQDQLDQLRPIVKLGMDAKEGLEDVAQEAKLLAEKQKVDAIKRAKSETIAIAEIKLIEARKGSAEELAARIGSIEAQRRIDMDDTTKGLNEKRLLSKKADKDIADAKRAYAVVGLENEKALIEEKISLAKKGSDEEFNAQKDLLAKQLQISLSDINLSIEKKKSINAKYYSDLWQMDKDHNAKKSTESLNAEISLIESELSSAKEGSAEEYQLKSDLIDKKRALDIKGIETSITDEKEKAAKIIEINSKAVKEVNELTLSKRVAAINELAATETLAVSKQYANGEINASQFEDSKRSITIKALESDIEVRKAHGEKTIEQEQQLADQRIAIAEREKEAKDALVQAGFDTVAMLGNAIMDGEKQRLNQQMNDLDHYYTTDAEAAKKNKNLKLISEAEYNKKQLKIKQDIAKADKKQATFNAILSGAQAIMGIWSKFAWFPVMAGILTALSVAQLAIQLNTIKNQPIPQYWKGKKGNSGHGEMAWVGEQGPEIMYVPNGASILPAHKSNKVRDAIGIMREYNIPVMPHISKSSIEEAKANGSSGINYDLLANKIGDQMEKRIRFPKMAGQRPVSINVDHSGTSVTDGDTTTHYRNRKYVGNV